MTSPYPPPPAPRRLERSTSNKVIAGVAGGLANYLNMDPMLVRVLVVALTLFTGGLPVILYIVAMFVMPEEGRNRSKSYPPVAPPQAYTGPDYGQQGFGQSYPPNGATPPAQEQPAYGAGPTSGSSPFPTYPGATASTSADDGVWGTAGAPWEQRHPEPAAPSPEPPSASTGSTQPGASSVDNAAAQDVHEDQAPAHHEPADEGAKLDETAGDTEPPAAKLPGGEGQGFNPRS